LLVLNLDKRGIDRYVGAGVFAEISFAVGRNLTCGKKIKIYLLNPVPENVLNSDELGYWVKLGWIELWTGANL